MIIDKTVDDGGFAHRHIPKEDYLVLNIAEAGTLFAMNHQLLFILNDLIKNCNSIPLPIIL